MQKPTSVSSCQSSDSYLSIQVETEAISRASKSRNFNFLSYFPTKDARNNGTFFQIPLLFQLSKSAVHGHLPGGSLASNSKHLGLSYFKINICKPKKILIFFILLTSITRRQPVIVSLTQIIC